MNFSELFSEGVFRHQMGLKRGSAAEYFKATDAAIAKERVEWLRRDPHKYSSLLTQGAPMLEECISLAREWQTIALDNEALLRAGPSTEEQCRRLGELWEPDFLLLRAEEEFRLVGGCVCFPSSWSLEEKIGRGLEVIHGPVPGLNESLGRGIAALLKKLAPGTAWMRKNWGLSRSPELNQHPSLRLPKLDAGVKENEIWLRVEHQILTPLPKTHGILFGIRVTMHPLAEVREDSDAARLLARALVTMPDEVAVYKGVEMARNRILSILNEDG